MKPQEYRVGDVEPGKPAREMMLGSDIKDLQKAVGGLTELIYAHDDRTVIVGNDEAKLIGMEGNRRLETGSIIAGPFFVIGDADLVLEYLGNQRELVLGRDVLTEKPEHSYVCCI